MVPPRRPARPHAVLGAGLSLLALLGTSVAALAQGMHDTAAKAFSRAIKLTEHSAVESLEPFLGMAKMHTEAGAPAAGFGIDGKPDFWIGGEGGLEKAVHVAIQSKDRAGVDAFHKAALAAGGKDNGAPGLRPHYHANYYGAFVLDPDGHNIEAVCHAPG